MPPHYILIVAILALSAGGLGGSFQPSRLILIVGFTLLSVRFAQRLPYAHRLETSAILFSVATLLLGGLTMFWTSDVYKGVSLWVTVAIGFLSFALVVSFDKSISRARQIRDAWSWSFILTIPFAIYEIFTNNHFAYALEERTLGGDSGTFRFASVFFGNYNNYCVFICLVLPMLFGTLDQSGTVRRRFFWIFIIAIAFFILVTNTSRAALIAALVTLIGYLILRRSAAAAGVVSATAVMLGSAAFFFQDDLDRFARMASLRFRGLLEGDESLSVRWDLLEFGGERLAQTWGFGGGVGDFEREVSLWLYNVPPNAHNFLMELAVNFTVFSLLAFGIFMFALFRGALKSSAPIDVRFAPLIGLPLMPLIGTLNSQAIGYTYWWIWIATLLFMVVAGSQPGVEKARKYSRRPFSL
jgi:teichuronic acid biosynthesis protein TuaE